MLFSAMELPLGWKGLPLRHSLFYIFETALSIGSLIRVVSPRARTHLPTTSTITVATATSTSSQVTHRRREVYGVEIRVAL
jgi:hypothetical protein